jgi:hypothetical protein
MSMTVEAKTLSNVSRAKESCAVTMRGQVLSVEVTDVPPSSVSIVVKLKLEILNNGAQPVIFLKEKMPLLVGYELIKNPDAPSPDNQLAVSFTGPGVNTSPEWAVLRQRLDQSSPPPDQVHILMPNERWAFDDTVIMYLSTEARDESTFSKNASWAAVQEASPVWLLVDYQVWPWNLEPPSNDRTRMTFGHKLQKRWQAVGLLQLDGIRSEPILLDVRNKKR